MFRVAGRTLDHSIHVFQDKSYVSRLIPRSVFMFVGEQDQPLSCSFKLSLNRRCYNTFGSVKKTEKMADCVFASSL